MLDNEEKTIKSKVDTYNKLLHSDDNQLNEDGEFIYILKQKIRCLDFDNHFSSQ